MLAPLLAVACSAGNSAPPTWPTWESINAPQLGSMVRTEVPEGWLLMTDNGYILYVPDPEHEWNRSGSTALDERSTMEILSHASAAKQARCKNGLTVFERPANGVGTIFGCIDGEWRMLSDRGQWLPTEWSPHAEPRQ